MIKDGNSSRILRSILVVFLSMTACSASAPKIEHCLIGEASLQCFDERLEEDKQQYDKTFEEAENYFCTNITDWTTYKEFAERRKKGSLTTQAQ